MSTRDSYAPGAFCWADLSTQDLDGAVAFYEALFGWEGDVEDTPGGGRFAAFLLDGRRVAGGFDGARTEWLSYVSVEDADGSAERAEELEAEIVAGPRDVDGLGRVVYLADPLGARFGLWQPRTTHGAEVVNEPGALTWNDLLCASSDSAKDFYGALFGWTFHDADPGRYSVIVNGERTNGGFLTVEDAPAQWLPYFVVENADRAAERITELGGRVRFGPQDVPAGRMCAALDPQGASFGVFEGEVDD